MAKVRHLFHYWKLIPNFIRGILFWLFGGVWYALIGKLSFEFWWKCDNRFNVVEGNGVEALLNIKCLGSVITMLWKSYYSHNVVEAYYTYDVEEALLHIQCCGRVTTNTMLWKRHYMFNDYMCNVVEALLHVHCCGSVTTHTMLWKRYYIYNRLGALPHIQ